MISHASGCEFNFRQQVFEEIGESGAQPSEVFCMGVEVLGSVMWSWGEVVVSGFKLPGAQEAVLKSTLGLYELCRHEIRVKLELAS